MWLKTLWTRLRNSQITQPFKDTPYTPSKRLQCAELLKGLGDDAFANYRPVFGLGAVLTVAYPTIDLYTAKLHEAATLVREEKAIKPDWSSPLELEVTVDAFLTSSDGYYLDNQAAVTQFKRAAGDLLDALESSDYVTHGLPEHNLRMLTKLLVNLQPIIAALIEVSAQR